MALRFTIKQLEYFVSVGELGSIAKASAKVNVSSPSISAAISQLEDEFGLALFVRKQAQGLSLTQAGRRFLEQARKVLAEANNLNRLAGSIVGNVQGPLSIGCFLTFAQLLLPSIRREFQINFPDVQVSQVECDQQKLFEKLTSAEIDIALSYDLEVPPDLEFIPLRLLPLLAVVATNHPLAKHHSVSIETLAEHPMVLLDLPISRKYFLNAFKLAGLTPDISEKTRDMAVMRSLVANGFGFSLANIKPHSNLSPDGQALKFIPIEGSVKPLRLGFIVAEGSRNVLAIDTFIEEATKIIAGWDYPGLSI
jgi:DNA-binding transcriptional LysR family regulator